jgi:PLP dependent protein
MDACKLLACGSAGILQEVTSEAILALRIEATGHHAGAISAPLTTENRAPLSIEENIARVEERIAAACRRSGRCREDVKLVAVSKTVPANSIRRAYEVGLRDFGENRVQEAEAKRPALSDLSPTWHLIGHLQTNKAKLARELFHWVQSVDSERLATRLDQATVCTGDRLPVLLEVNLGGEATKAGAREDEVCELAERIGELQTLELRGLMAIPPFFENPDQVRPFFRRLRGLAKAIGAKKFPNVSVAELSMGMSHDFEVAIEEGATIIRLGTAIFGPLSAAL